MDKLRPNKFFPEYCTIIGNLKAHLYQASASMHSQHCDDTCDIDLIEENGVTTKWVAMLS